MNSHRTPENSHSKFKAKKLPLAVALPMSVGMVLTSTAIPASATVEASMVQATQLQQTEGLEADLLDVTFDDGTAADAAQGREASTFGEPTMSVDGQLARMTADFSGEDAISYPMTSEDYTAMEDGFTVECNFMATAETSGEDTVCGNKEGGGWGMVVKDGQAAFMIHAEGGYTFAWADINMDQWYHATGVYDGETVKLYLDGELAAEGAAGGPMTVPPDGTAHNTVIGADSGGNNEPAQYSSTKVDDVRLYSQPATDAQVASLNEEFAMQAEIPSADLFNVDFTDGSTEETAQGLPATTQGDPEVAMDPALGRHTATFDGDDALQYPMGEQYDSMSDSFSVECVFRYNGDFPSSGQANLCANKEAGGFAMAMFSDELTLELHTGSYQQIGMQLEPNEWYHAVAVFDGPNQTAQLYVNGELAGEVETVGSEMVFPPDATAHNMTLGADSSKGGAQFYSTSSLASARVYSQPLSATQVAALNVEAFDGLRDQQALPVTTNPEAGSELTSATEFAVEWDNPDVVAEGTTYTLDGEEIAPGDVIGPGLNAGEHTIAIEGKTVFGAPISETVTFTSGAIPEDGGTQTGQGEGTVTLSSVSTNPDGGDVTSTFRAGRADLADGGFQGLVDAVPETLEFEYTDGTELDGSGDSLTAGKGQIAFQRFDVEVGEATEGQAVRWSGNVDPSREVKVMAWNTATQTWDEVASGRGLNEGELVLSGDITAEHVTGEGTASVLVTAEDPFADDLPNSIEQSFENPDDFDFSIAHVTDTQYLAEGAAEDAYSAEQQAVWADAYTDTMEWIVNNAEEHKIDYVAHTGDIMENWHTSTERDDEEAYREIATEEFEFVSEAQKILDDAQIVNGVLPGNHDNRSGSDVGVDSLYNEYFHPDRYDALEQTQGWQDAQASFTPWREGDNENHYDLFTAGGLDFIAVYLGFDVTEEELAWASDVLEQYPDRNAMVMSHAHRAPSTNPDGRGAGFSHDGAPVDQSVLQQHDNVFLVLSGHEHGVDIEVRKDVGMENNNIVELLADYQFYEVSAEELGLTGIDGRSPEDMLRFGSSFFRLLQIDVDNSEMAVDTYSPMLDDFGATEYDDRQRYNGTEDDTRLPIQLETRQTSFATDQVMVTTPSDEVIGEDTAESGWPTSVEWSGLTEGETYAWYVTSRDAESGEDLPTGESEQMGVFTATAAGTDTVAPELTVPESTSIAAGDAFDPMEGVSATDDTDGDLTSEVQVSSSVDTTTPGTYAVHYVVEDANGNQAIASSAVTVTEAADGGQGGSDDGAGDGEDGSTNPDESEDPEDSDGQDGSDDQGGSDDQSGSDGQDGSGDQGGSDDGSGDGEDDSTNPDEPDDSEESDSQGSSDNQDGSHGSDGSGGSGDQGGADDQGGSHGSDGSSGSDGQGGSSGSNGASGSSSGDNQTVDTAGNSSGQSGQVTSADDSTRTSANQNGFLANTGAQGMLGLVAGGVLLVGAGATAWYFSRRRNAMNN